MDSKSKEVIVDRLGRINLSQQIREKLDIKEGEKFESYIENEDIILKRVDENKADEIVEEKVGNILNVKKINGHLVRTLDELFRIVLPLEIRDKLQIKENDKLFEYVKDNDKIILQKI